MAKRKKATNPIQAPPDDVDQRIAAVLRFARFSGPTGDIEEILEEIERGRDIRRLLLD